MTGTNVKITINGREYSSLDEVPEEMRHLIQDRIATAMASAATTGDPGFAPQPQLLTPAEYRRQIESQQSGRAPEAFQGERGLGIALWAIIALCAAGLATGYSIPVLFFTIAFSTLGLIGLWYRRQNRALSPVPLHLANRVQGAFVVVIGGRGKLFFAREAWHGAAGFDPPASTVRPIRASTRRSGLRPCGSRFTAGRYSAPRRRARRGALERLRRFGDLSVSVHGNLARVNLHRDLATMHGRLRRDRDEDILERFLADACAVVDAAAVRSR